MLRFHANLLLYEILGKKKKIGTSDVEFLPGYVVNVSEIIGEEKYTQHMM